MKTQWWKDGSFEIGLCEVLEIFIKNQKTKAKHLKKIKTRKQKEEIMSLFKQE